MSERLRRFRAIWLVPVLALIALGGWAFASPPGSSPDDDFHAASIWCAGASHTDLCKPGANPSERRIATALLRINCYAGDEDRSASCLTNRLSHTGLVESARGNFVGAYPPLYYGVMSVFISNDIPTSLLVMRFVNIVSFIGITSLLYLLLPRPRRQTLIWGWLIALVPLGLFLIASNNPSSWTIIGVGSLPLALLGFFETIGRTRLALAGLSLLSALMAAGSRADGAVYCVLVTIAVLVLVIRRDRIAPRMLWLPGAVILICAAFAVVSAQITSSVAGFAAVAPVAATAAPTAAPSTAPSVVALLGYNILNTPSIWAGVFGSWPLGWFDTKLPAVVSLGALAVYVAAVFTGLRDLTRRKLIVIVATAVGLWAIPVVTLTRSLDRVGVDVQPRYLLPLIIVLGTFALLTTGAGRLLFTRVQRILLAATLSGTAIIAQYFDIRRYVTGVDVRVVDLDAGAEWWWSGVPGPTFFWILGSVAWVALIAFVVRASTSSNPVEPVALRE